MIRLIGQLDYERSSLHQLRVLATDRANDEKVSDDLWNKEKSKTLSKLVVYLQRKTGTAAILVKVEDVEDQPPEFVVVTQVTRISEDAPVGSTVLQGNFF